MAKIIHFISVILVFISALYAQSADKPMIIMQDGQLKTHPVRVFIANANITSDMQPVLCLVAINQKTRIESGNILCKGPSFQPFEIAPNQTLSYNTVGTPIMLQGTMMLFDFARRENPLKIPFYAAGMRVLPVLTWIAKKTKLPNNNIKFEYSKVISENEIYIGNRTGGFFWTIFLLFTLVMIIFILEWKGKKKPLDVIRLAGGRISLSLLQMALWTLVVGGMVFAFGIMHLSVPNIPDSLVVLMGFSIATTAAGHYQSNLLKNLKEELGRDIKKNVKGKKSLFSGLSSLINITVEEKEYPSIAKAQYLFWTITTIVLFVYKSSVEGALWPIPEELIFLMGISQGSYLFRNQMEISSENKVMDKREKELKKKEEEELKKKEEEELKKKEN